MNAAARPTSGLMPREELVFWLDYAIRLRRIYEIDPEVFEEMIAERIRSAEGVYTPQLAKLPPRKGRR